jgi:hypothetical protein
LHGVSALTAGATRPAEHITATIAPNKRARTAFPGRIRFLSKIAGGSNVMFRIVQ